MSLNQVQPSEPGSSAIRKLMENTRYAYNRADRALFWKYELSGIYTMLGASGSTGLYANDLSLGHTLASYGNWTHINAQTGMSIWKYPVSNYQTNSVNEMYVNDLKLTYMGSASSVDTPTTLKGVWYSNGKRSSATETDITTEVASISGTPVLLMNTSSIISTAVYVLDTPTNLGWLNVLQGTVTVYSSGYTTLYTENTDYTIDYDLAKITVLSTGSILSAASIHVSYIQAGQLYLTHGSKFGSVNWSLATLGVGNTIEYAYMSGSSYWHTFNPTDSTSNLSVNGNTTWSAVGLTGWVSTAAWGSGYHIRVRPKSQGIVVPTIWQLAISDNEMVKLLAMSTTDFTTQNYKWGYLSGFVYIAIPNNGDSSNEGVNYVTSTSTATTLQNYFVYNNEYSVNYEYLSGAATFSIDGGTT